MSISSGWLGKGDVIAIRVLNGNLLHSVIHDLRSPRKIHAAAKFSGELANP